MTSVATLSVLSVAALVNLLLVGVWTSKLDASVNGRTLVQNGRVFWSMSDQSATYPGQWCVGGIINQAIVTDYGTGYSVGDLIVAFRDPAGPYIQSFVYRVTAVDPADGAVVQYAVLTPGCMDINHNVTVTTMTAGSQGSGFTVIINSNGSVDPQANDGVFYTFPPAPGNLVAPLVEGTYALYKTQEAGVGGAESYILELAPMRYPLDMRDHVNPHYGLSLYVWGFNATITGLDPNADKGILIPLVPSTKNAMVLSDDADCFAEETNCYLSAYDSNDWRVRDSLNWGQYNFDIGNGRYVTNGLHWNYGSFTGTFDYGANNATFQTTAPLAFVL